MQGVMSSSIFNYDEFTALIKEKEIFGEFEKFVLKDEMSVLPTNTGIVFLVAVLIACLDSARSNKM